MTAAVNECFTWHRLRPVPAVRFTASIRAKRSAREMDVDDTVAACVCVECVLAAEVCLRGHSAVYL